MGMESVDNRNGAKKNIVTAKNFQLIGQGNWITLYLSCIHPLFLIDILVMMIATVDDDTTVDNYRSLVTLLLFLAYAINLRWFPAAPV